MQTFNKLTITTIACFNRYKAKY